GCGDHRSMQMIRGRVVDDVDGGVGDEILESSVRLRHAERVRFRARGNITAAGDRNDVDETETADGIDVVRADETRADQAHSNSHASAALANAKHFFTSSTGLPSPRYSYSTSAV